MVLLRIKNIVKSFGVNMVIKDAALTVMDKQRVGLVGANGSGKTTLLNIIAGLDAPDSGEMSFAKGARVAYFTQDEQYTSDKTVWDELLTVFEPVLEMEKSMRDMEVRMGEAHEDAAAFAALCDEYSDLTHAFETAGGYAYKSSMLGALAGLGFKSAQHDQVVNTLSGGERTRLRLAKLLLTPCDLMLLDEPTNHLDLPAAAWLEGTLKAFSGAVLVVSHDRYFLDTVCQSVVEMSFGVCEQYEGNYSRYLKLRQEVYERRLKAYGLQQKEIERQKAIIQRYRSYATEDAIKKAKTREHVLERMDKLDRPMEEKTVRFSFEARHGTGNDVLIAEDLSKSYGERTLLDGLTFTVKAGERVALIGPNGAGKTTLLRMLLGDERPDRGAVRLGARVEVGYFDQQQSRLSPEKTVLDEVWDDFRRLEQLDIRNALAAFLLTGDDVFQRMDTLSGGEKARVMLTKLMLKGDNFLILDEPTNHLDMDSRELLEDSLADFDGTLLTVSHDRYFINKVATRIIELKDGGAILYEGNYDDYLARRAAEDMPEDDAPSRNRTAERKEREKQKALASKERERRLALESLESRIMDLEEEATRLEIEMSDPDTARDHQRSAGLARRYDRVRKEIEGLYGELDALL